MQSHRDKVNGKLSVPPEQYREKMEKIVARRKETSAELIWCATTPVPEGEAGRKVGDEIAYNLIAAEIMGKNTPPFPALRSDPMALSGASRRKQTPSSRCSPVWVEAGAALEVGTDNLPGIGADCAFRHHTLAISIARAYS